MFTCNKFWGNARAEKVGWAELMRVIREKMHAISLKTDEKILNSSKAFLMVLKM